MAAAKKPPGDPSPPLRSQVSFLISCRAAQECFLEAGIGGVGVGARGISFKHLA